MKQPLAAGVSPDSDQIARTIAAELAHGALRLPVLPGVAAEVLSSSVDERTDAARLAGLVQRDQSLASHVLRVCNSAAFHVGSEIVSLQQAIARLGMVRVREIVLSASLKGVLIGKGPYAGHADRLWRDALAAGLWAKEVARAARRSVEIAYLCGLLQRIGAALVLLRLGEIAPALNEAQVCSLLERLERRCGVALARAWSLPAPVSAAIEHLDDPEAAGRHAELVAAAGCGARLARPLVADGAVLPELLDLRGVGVLNLYPEDFERVLARRAEVEAAVASMVL